MNKEDFKILAKRTTNSSIAKTSEDIYKIKEIHAKFILSEFHDFVKFFEDFFDFLNLVVQKLNYVEKKNWKPEKSIQYLHYPETMKTLHRAFEDVLDGYYEESLMLLRCVYEAYIKMIFVSYYPEDRESIFVDRNGRVGFNLTNFIEHQLKFDWKFIYKVLSVSSHAKSHTHLKRLIKISEKKDSKPIQLIYYTDKKEASRSVNIIYFLLYALLHFLDFIANEDIDQALDATEKQRYIDVLKVLRSILETTPSFSKVVNDIDKIKDIITNRSS
ncbi:MAG: hypothetical protein JW871_03260 [Endomicrobiales bacterium]|nr:hypothetical protein [Endomicrobiales bacterium]